MVKAFLEMDGRIYIYIYIYINRCHFFIGQNIIWIIKYKIDFDICTSQRSMGLNTKYF